MGGHDHHHAPYKVPSADSYKVSDAPKLVEVEQALARVGLKDPWLRNEVWRFDPNKFGTHAGRCKTFFLRGFVWGLAATVVTVSAEFAISKISGGDEHEHDHH